MDIKILKGLKPPTEQNVCDRCGCDRGYYLDGEKFIPADECDICAEHAEAIKRKEQQKQVAEANIKDWLVQSGVPARYADVTLVGFNDSHIKGGGLSVYMNSLTSESSLYMYGSSGSGKTHLAVCALRHALMNAHVTSAMARFVCVPDMLARIRDGIKDGDMEQRINELCTVPFLILDDLGTERASEFALETLYRIINDRYNDMRRTIITSNYNPEKYLIEKCGMRISSRVIGMCNVIWTGDYDYRRGQSWR